MGLKFSRNLSVVSTQISLSEQNLPLEAFSFVTRDDTDELGETPEGSSAVCRACGR